MGCRTGDSTRGRRKAIAEEMEVNLIGVHKRKDSDIAQAVVNALNGTCGCQAMSRQPSRMAGELRLRYGIGTSAAKP